MVLKIKFDIISQELITPHFCDLKYNPSLNNIITFTSHLEDLLYDDENLIFSIIFNDKEIPIYKYDFILLVEQINNCLEKINLGQNFDIDFYEQGETISIKFIKLKNQYCIEIFDFLNAIKLEEYGSAHINIEDLKSLLKSVLKKYIEITKKYCNKSYQNKFFREIFKDFI